MNTHANGTVEAGCLYTSKIHFAHLDRRLVEAFPIKDLTLAVLREYVNWRAKAVDAATLRREISTPSNSGSQKRR